MNGARRNPLPARPTRRPRRPSATVGQDPAVPLPAHDSDRAALPASAPSARYSLSVASGLQSGARLLLRPGRVLTVGQGVAEDVRLRDPCAAGARISLVVDETGVSVRSVAGAVRVQDRPLDAGQSIRLVPGQSLSLGEVSLCIDLQCAQPAEPAGTGLPPPEREPEASRPPRSDVHPAIVPVAPGGARSTARFGALALGVLALGSAWWFGSRTLTSERIAPVPVALLLQGSKFSGLNVNDDGHRVTVDGVVSDRAALAELDALLVGAEPDVLNRVETDESVATQVLDVLRVNGAEAELVASDAGDVVATTTLPASRDLQGLAELVRQDIPALATLTLNNDPPKAVVDATARLDAGKRVAMVVSANPAHVVTDDRSRYFVGSLLPSGHRIMAIADNRVSLELDGVRTLLEF